MDFWPVVLEGDVNSMHEFMYRSCTQGGPLYSGRDRASEKTLNFWKTSNLNKGGPSLIHLFDWRSFEPSGLVMVFWSVVKNSPYLCTLEICGASSCIAPVYDANVWW